MGLGHGSSLSWWNLTGGTDSLRTYIATNKVVQSGLVLNLDAGASTSYPGSGTTWTDLSGGGNNGTLTNGPTYSSANGGSIVFDGSNDVVALPNLGIAPSGSRTLNVWIKPSSLTGQQTVFAYGVVAGLTVFALLLNTASSGDVYVSFGAGDLYTTGNAISTSQYWNICVTYGGGALNANTSIYVNGILKSLTDVGPNRGSVANTTNTSYQVGTVSGAFYPGNIASCSFYNRALSAAEVSQNFNALRGRFSV